MIAQRGSIANQSAVKHLRGRIQTVLLSCGILSPLLYAVADGLAGSRWGPFYLTSHLMIVQ